MEERKQKAPRKLRLVSDTLTGASREIDGMMGQRQLCSSQQEKKRIFERVVRKKL